MTTSRPAGLGDRGAEFWDALMVKRTPDAAWAILAAEACRMVDRLEQLDRLLRRDIDVWARIEMPDDGGPTVLIFDDALGEARQLAGALRQLLGQLKVGVSSVEAAETERKSALDVLADRRARRSATSA